MRAVAYTCLYLKTQDFILMEFGLNLICAMVAREVGQIPGESPSRIRKCEWALHLGHLHSARTCYTAVQPGVLSVDGPMRDTHFKC